jgi:hypothetical protein
MIKNIIIDVLLLGYKLWQSHRVTRFVIVVLALALAIIFLNWGIANFLSFLILVVIPGTVILILKIIWECVR